MKTLPSEVSKQITSASVSSLLLAPVRRCECGGMHAEVKSLVIQGGDRIADDLVRQFAHGFPHQIVGLGQFGAGEAAGHTYRRSRSEIEDNPAFDVTSERDHAATPLRR